MVKKLQKVDINEKLQNSIYTSAIFDFDKGTTFEIYIEQSEKTEPDIFRMIKIDNSVFEEYRFEYDFLKSIIEKYAIQV